MPELPEVEIVKRALQNKIIDEVIETVEILREQSIGFPEVNKFSSRLKGTLLFSAISRRGKNILIFAF